MKIIIKAEPKEIAALEQALKDGGKITLDGEAIAKAAQRAYKLVPSFGLCMTDSLLTKDDALAGGPPMDCPKKRD